MVGTLQVLVAPCGRHFGLFRSILHAKEHCKIVEINAFQLNNPPISLLKMELKNLGLLRKNTRKFTFASPTLKKITQ
jgi:hypothetical protein